MEDQEVTDELTKLLNDFQHKMKEITTPSIMEEIMIDFDMENTTIPNTKGKQMKTKFDETTLDIASEYQERFDLMVKEKLDELVMEKLREKVEDMMEDMAEEYANDVFDYSNLDSDLDDIFNSLRDNSKY